MPSTKDLADQVAARLAAAKDRPAEVTIEDFFHRGDLVVTPRPRPGDAPDAVYRVVDTPGGPRTTYLVENVRTGAALKGPAGAFRRYDGPAIETPEPLPPLAIGAVVAVNPTASKSIDETVPYLVFGYGRADDSYKVMPIGGAPKGAYWTLPRRALRPLSEAPLVAVAQDQIGQVDWS